MNKIVELENLIQAQRQYREDSIKSLCDDIGRNLHAEFEDFHQTKDMPMCDMLGEIYRCKLDNIEKILKRYNINV